MEEGNSTLDHITKAWVYSQIDKNHKRGRTVSLQLNKQRGMKIIVQWIILQQIGTSILQQLGQ